MNSPNPYQAPASDVSQQTNQTYQPKFFTINGRIGRLRYMAYSMLGFLLLMPIFVLGGIMTDGENPGAAFIGLVYIPLIAYAVILMKRRFNDMGRSGWFGLLSFIPLVNIIVYCWLIFGRGTDGENNFGLAPNANPLSVKIAGSILPLIFFLGMFAAIALPAYQDYVERVKAAQG